uniref:Uncharacterized protein n=1 Tax=Nothobranchius furzeri TaxID=105023 RepID=A0A8C6NKC8_NOTFU
MHITVHRLLLPVQRLLQNKLCELVPVALRLHVQEKVVVVGDGVGAERVGANVRVEGVLHREARSRSGALGYFHGNVRLREAGWIVVDVHHLDLHAKELQRVFQEHLEVQQAQDGLLTDFFSVDFLLHDQRSVLQPQTLCNIPNHRARLLLLWHGEVELTESSIQN